jgi:hypothetical protein
MALAFHSLSCHQMPVEEVQTFHSITSIDFHALAWVSVLWNGQERSCCSFLAGALASAFFTNYYIFRWK